MIWLNETIKISGNLQIYEIEGDFDCNCQDDSKACTCVPTFEQVQKFGKLVVDKKNMITNVGFNTIANRLTGDSTYASTYFPYFAISNGSVAPSATRTASDFYADGTTYTKAVTTLETFSTATLSQQWTCFLTSTENTVASITKFALMNANPGTVMFNEILFAAISKNSTKSLYLKYVLTMSRV